MAPIIIVLAINIGGVILSVASLSFLGFGLPAARFLSWGGLLSREGRQYMEHGAMAGALARGFALTIVVYSLQHVRRRGQGPA